MELMQVMQLLLQQRLKRFRKQIRQQLLLKNPLTNPKPVLPTKQPQSFSNGQNAALVAQLKADSEKRSAQMQSLVTQMFQKQGIAIGTADDMWKVLASGNFTADADTIAQAKEDISEDGYWGVNQTSDRIFSFALALSNGDEKQMEKMVKAVKRILAAPNHGVRSCLLFQAIRTALLWINLTIGLRKTALLPQLPICSNKSLISRLRFIMHAASYCGNYNF